MTKALPSVCHFERTAPGDCLKINVRSEERNPEALTHLELPLQKNANVEISLCAANGYAFHGQKRSMTVTRVVQKKQRLDDSLCSLGRTIPLI